MTVFPDFPTFGYIFVVRYCIGLHVWVRAYCWLHVFLKYILTDALNYEKAPRSHRGAEGTWRWLRFLVVLATTHGQSRAHRGELTELGIRLRRSWGDGEADGQMCVSLSLRDGVRAVLRLDIVSQSPRPRKRKKQHKHRLRCTRALCTYIDTREHESLIHSLTHSLTHSRAPVSHAQHLYTTVHVDTARVCPQRRGLFCFEVSPVARCLRPLVPRRSVRYVRSSTTATWRWSCLSTGSLCLRTQPTRRFLSGATRGAPQADFEFAYLQGEPYVT